MDGITFTEIVEASNNTTRLTSGNYPSNIYTKILPSSFTTPYLYFGFVVNRLVGNDVLLNFAEWQLYGIDTVNSGTQIKHVYITSNVLQSQNYINSNSITNVLTPYISSNILQIQNYINSNSITNVLTPYINSNILQIQNYINSNSITNVLTPYINSNTLQSQNYINSNSITNVLTPYINSNALKYLTVYDTPNLQKKIGFTISCSTPAIIDGTMNVYWKYDIDLRLYTKTQSIPYSGSPFRIFNIKVFIASGYFDVLNPDGTPTCIQYDIYMSNEVGNGTMGGHSGLNLQANGTPENARLDKIFNNFFFILKNDTDFNYISVISSYQDIVVNCIITDNLF